MTSIIFFPVFKFKANSCVIRTFPSCFCRRKLVFGLEPKETWKVKGQANFESLLSQLRSQMWQLLTFSLWGQSPTQLSDVSDTNSASNHVNPSSGDPPPSGPSTPGRTEESRQQAQSRAEPQARSAVDAPAAASQRLPSNSNTAKVAGGLEVCMPKV